jgi:electron transport complex protein RnfG
MYRSMVGIAALCGLLIVSVYRTTRPVIERKRAEALRQAIFFVLPEARSAAAFRLTADERFERLAAPAAGEGLVYAAYDARQRLIGFAVTAEGMGYADVIRVLYGYSVTDEAIVGLRVLESKETPGLGDRIETDPEFRRNFEKLDVTLDDDLSQIVHPIEAVKQGRKQQPWQVDGITGATISSKAIAGSLARSTAYWVPRIRRNLEAFEAAE